MERQMKKMLTIAAFVAGIGAATPLAQAQSYVINGHAASVTEVQRLVSYGAQPGNWVVDGYGITSAAHGPDQSASAGEARPKCWYVLDVQLCE
jgi:hypothetical protein